MATPIQKNNRTLWIVLTVAYYIKKKNNDNNKRNSL